MDFSELSSTGSDIQLTGGASRLTDSQQQMRDLMAHAHTAIEQERKRIAQNIHDELGSLLTAMKLELALLTLETREIRDELQQRLDSMHRLIEDAILVTRQIASDLRPVVLNLGLLASVEWLAENFRRRSGISCQVIANDEIALNDVQSTTLFRIIQESLTNIIRHADASATSIDIKMENDTLWLTIADNGRGFDSKEIAGNSFGLIGIRERLETLAGKLYIESAPGRGTRLSISMPIHDNTP